MSLDGRTDVCNEVLASAWRRTTHTAGRQAQAHSDEKNDDDDDDDDVCCLFAELHRARPDCTIH